MSEPTSTPMPDGHHDNNDSTVPPARNDTTSPPPPVDLDTLPNRRARDGARFADTAAVRRHFLDLAQRPGANTAALRALAGDPELQITSTGNFATIRHVTSRRWTLILTGVGSPLDAADFTTREEADAADQYIAKHVLNGHIRPDEFMQPIDFSAPNIADWFESWRSTRGEDAAQAIHRAVRDFRATQTTDEPPAAAQRQARFTTLQQVRDNWTRKAAALRASGTEQDRRAARDLESLAKEQRLRLVGNGQFVTRRVDDVDWYLYATGSGRHMSWWFDRQRDAAAFAEHIVGRLLDKDGTLLDFSDPEFTDWATWRSAKGRDYHQEWTAARALWDQHHPPKHSIASDRLAETLRRRPLGDTEDTTPASDAPTATTSTSTEKNDNRKPKENGKPIPRAWADEPVRALKGTRARPRPARKSAAKDDNRRFKTLSDVERHWATGELAPYTKDKDRQERHTQAVRQLFAKLQNPQLSKGGNFVVAKTTVTHGDDTPEVWYVIDHVGTGGRMIAFKRKSVAVDFANRLEEASVDGKPFDWESPGLNDRLQERGAQKEFQRLAIEAREAYGNKVRKERGEDRTPATETRAQETPDAEADGSPEESYHREIGPWDAYDEARAGWQQLLNDTTDERARTDLQKAVNSRHGAIAGDIALSYTHGPDYRQGPEYVTLRDAQTGRSLPYASFASSGEAIGFLRWSADPATRNPDGTHKYPAGAERDRKWIELIAKSKSHSARFAQKWLDSQGNSPEGEQPNPLLQAAQEIADRSGVPDTNVVVGHVGPRTGENRPGRPSSSEELRELWKGGGAPSAPQDAAHRRQTISQRPDVVLHLADHRGFAIVEHTNRTADRFEVRTAGNARPLRAGRLLSAGEFDDLATANRFSVHVGAEVRDENGQPVDWGSPTFDEDVQGWRSENGEQLGGAMLRVAGEFDIDRGEDGTAVARLLQKRRDREQQSDDRSGGPVNAADESGDSPTDAANEAGAEPREHPAKSEQPDWSRVPREQLDEEYERAVTDWADGDYDDDKEKVGRSKAEAETILSEAERHDTHEYTQQLSRIALGSRTSNGDTPVGIDDDSQNAATLQGSTGRWRWNRAGHGTRYSSDKSFLTRQAALADLVRERDAEIADISKREAERQAETERQSLADMAAVTAAEQHIAQALDQAQRQIVPVLNDLARLHGQAAAAELGIRAVDAVEKLQQGETTPSEAIQDFQTALDDIQRATRSLEGRDNIYAQNLLRLARENVSTARQALPDQQKRSDNGAIRGSRSDVLADVPTQRGSGDAHERRPGPVRPDPVGGDRGGHQRPDGRVGAASSGGDRRGGARQRAEVGADAGPGTGPARVRVRDGEGAGHGDEGHAEGVPAYAVAFGTPEQQATAASFEPPASGETLAPSSPANRAKANIAAIEILHRLEAENRPATPGEQQSLARYSGWGAVPQIFKPKPDDQFEPLAAKLRELLTDDEWADAGANTLNAHYTDPQIVQQVWAAVESLGFNGGMVLEPGSGIGNFIGYAPDSAHVTGVEIDPITARIAKALYPSSDIRHESFGDTRAPNGAFDLVIGNVPFGRYKVPDLVHNKGAHSIHNHFILKSLDLTRAGGLVAAVSSALTMDGHGKKAEAARMEMAEKAELVGVLRLPSGAHQRTAGTRVVTDLLIFRRREKDKAFTSGRTRKGEVKQPSDRRPNDPPMWVHSLPRFGLPGQADPLTDREAQPVFYNSYFHDHPEQILGELAVGHGLNRDNELRVDGDGDTFANLARALKRMVAAAKDAGLGYQPAQQHRQRVTLLPPGSSRVDGHVQAEPDGTFTQVRDSMVHPFPVPKSQADEARKLLAIRDTFQSLLTEESRKAADEALIERLRQDLNDRYEAYFDKYGAINRFTWAHRTVTDPETGEQVQKAYRKRAPRGGLFSKDPTMANISPLDAYDENTGQTTRTAIFTKRQGKYREIAEHADDPQDALAIVLEREGRLTADGLARVMNTDAEDAVDRLLAARSVDPDTGAEYPLAFQAPDGELVPAADYLSGNVRKKLAAAREAAAGDTRFDVNAEYLAQVIPPDLSTGEIAAPMGAAWIGREAVEEFLRETLGHNEITVSWQGGALWSVDAPRSAKGAIAYRTKDTWSAPGYDALNIAEAILANRKIRVTVKTREGTVFDPEATEDAKAKAELLKEAFTDWLWADPDRADKYKRFYNDNFNAMAPRSYDGQRRIIPGLVEWFKPHPHQHAAVARMVNEPSVLLAHEVGAGKTAEMAMGVMELRRLGLVKKAAIVVPGHMLDQFRTEFAELFPESVANNRILTASNEDLAGKGRREFIARAAAGDYDAIIMTQTAFESIQMRPEVQESYVRRRLERLEEKILNQKKIDGEDNDTRLVKRMQTQLKTLREKLHKKLSGLKDEAGLHFEDMGIDYLLVDEAHMYKNLDTPSYIAPIEGSNRASDLEMKLEWLRERSTSGRVVTFATATPVANSIAEVHTMMRYLRPDLLQQLGLMDFDDFASVFGQMVSAIERSADGTYNEKVRLAAFQNVPELLRLWRTFADVKTFEDLDLPVPGVAGGKAVTITMPMSEAQVEYEERIKDRAARLASGNVDPREDNHLKLLTDGRLAALDPRLIDPDMGPGNKLPTVADNIHRIYEQTKDAVYPTDKTDPTPHLTPGALQFVFLDLGTPKDPGKTKKRKKKAGTASEAAGNGEAAAEAGDSNEAYTDFSTYDELKKLLIARGIPSEKIRFIHEAKDDAAKARLFHEARSGKISVLLGSTAKMGTGTNAQLRAVALHHVDAPWRPADVEQRNGRIIRQGNANDQVAIFQYATERSTDAKFWEAIARKAKFIRQLMRGSLNERVVEDIGEIKFDADEASALVAGDPHLIAQAQIRPIVKRLRARFNAFQRSQEGFKRAIRDAEVFEQQVTPLLATLTSAIDKRKPTRGNAFNARFGKIDFAGAEDREKARSALNASLRAVIDGGRQGAYDAEAAPTVIGSVGGLDITARYERWKDLSGRPLHVVRLDIPAIPDSFDTYGYEHLVDVDGKPYRRPLMRIEDRIAHLESRIRYQEDEFADRQRAADQAKSRLGKPFELADEYDKSNRQLDILNEIMRLKAQHIGSEEDHKDRQASIKQLDTELRSMLGEEEDLLAQVSARDVDLSPKTPAPPAITQDDKGRVRFVWPTTEARDAERERRLAAKREAFLARAERRQRTTPALSDAGTMQDPELHAEIERLAELIARDEASEADEVRHARLEREQARRQSRRRTTAEQAPAEPDNNPQQVRTDVESLPEDTTQHGPPAADQAPQPASPEPAGIPGTGPQAPVDTAGASPERRPQPPRQQAADAVRPFTTAAERRDALAAVEEERSNVFRAAELTWDRDDIPDTVKALRDATFEAIAAQEAGDFEEAASFLAAAGDRIQSLRSGLDAAARQSMEEPLAAFMRATDHYLARHVAAVELHRRENTQRDRVAGKAAEQIRHRVQGDSPASNVEEEERAARTTKGDGQEQQPPEPTSDPDEASAENAEARPPQPTEDPFGTKDLFVEFGLKPAQYVPGAAPVEQPEHPTEEPSDSEDVPEGQMTFYEVSSTTGIESEASENPAAEEVPSAMAPAHNDAAGPRAATDGEGERPVEHSAQSVPGNQDRARTRAAGLARRIQKLREGMEAFDADLRAIDDLLAEAQAVMTAEIGAAAFRFCESRRPVIDAARRVIQVESAHRPGNLWDLPAGESAAGLDSAELALRIKELLRIRGRAEAESAKFFSGILTLDDILVDTCWRVTKFLTQQPDADTGGITALKGRAEDALQLLREALARQSVTRMNPVGNKGNWAEVNAIKAEEGFGLPYGTVLRETITGFRIGERVLRRAEVIVHADPRPSESTPELTLAAGDRVTLRQPGEPSDIQRAPQISPADMPSEELGEEIDNLDERIALMRDSTDSVDLAYRFRLEQRLFELQELERRRWRPEPQYDEHGKEVPRSRASVIHDRLDGYGLDYTETEGLTHRVEDLPPAKQGSYSDEEWKRIDAAAAAREDFPPTDEQRVTIEGAARRRLNMAVLALAGTGKSTLLKMLSHRMPDQNIVYLAFTKSVAAEAREAQARGEYADNMVALTANAYAARATDRRLNDRLPGNKKRDFKKLKPQQVADRMRWYDTVPAGNRDLGPAAAAAVASNALAQWAKSADAELGPQHVHGKTEQERRDLFTAIKPLADRMWANLTDPEAGDPDHDLPMDFDYIVKQWALGGYRLDADTLFWDEAQDVNPVLEGVVRGAIEQGIHVVAVGDSNQAIYGFRGASDALSKIPVDARATLTQSFRFGPAVADSGNRFLRLLGTKMRLKGFDAKQSRIEELHPGDESMIIALTNAGVALAAVQAITAGRTVAVAGGVKDLQEFVQAARALAAGEKTSHSELARFNGMPYDDILKEVNAAPDLQQLASLFNLLKKHPEEVDALLESGSRPATTELTADRVWVHLDWNAPSAQDLKAWLGSKTNGVGKLLYHPDTRRYYYEPGKREVPWSAPNGRFGIHKIDNKLSLEEAQQRIDAYLAKLYPEPTAEDGRGRVVPEGEPHDVLVTTAHKAKGLESERVRIAGDFKGPERDGDGHIVWETMPDDEALRVAYVALTRATEVLDPGGLGWVFEATKGDDPTQPPTDEYRRDFHLSDFTAGDTIRFEDEDGTPKTGVVDRITPPTLTVLSEGDEPGIATTQQEISPLQVVLRNGEIPPLLPVASDEELDQAIADGQEQEQRQREVNAIADEVDFAERAQRAMSGEHNQRLVDLLGAYREGSGDPVQILQAIADVLEEFAAEVESTERGTGRGRLGAGWARKARDRARQAVSRHERRGDAAPVATEQESAAGTRRDSDLEESRKTTGESAVAGDRVPTPEANAATGDQSAGQPAQPETTEQPATSSTPPADDGNAILLPVVSDEFSILFAASKGLVSSRHPSDGTPDHSVVHLRAQDSAGVLAEPDVVRHLIDQRALRLSSSGVLVLTETGRQRLGRTNLSARPEPAAGDRVLLDGTGHVGVVCGYRTSQGIRYAEVVADRNGWPQGWDTTVYPRYLTILERGVMGQEQAAELYRVAARREQAPDTEPTPEHVEGEGNPAAQASLVDEPPADAVDTKPVPMPDAKTDRGREGTQAKSESDPNDAAQREVGGSPTGEREVTSAAQTAPAPVGSTNGDQAPAESASSAQHEGAEELDQLGRMAAVLDVVARALKCAKDADEKAMKAAQKASKGNQESRDESMIAAYQHLQEAERHEANAQAAHAADDESSLMSYAQHLVRAAMETQKAAGVPTTATSLFDVLNGLRPAAERAAREELAERLRTELDRELTAVMRMDEANRDRLLGHRYLAERAVAELGWWTTLAADMAHAYQGRLWLDEQGKPHLLRRTAEGRTELGRTVSAPRVQLLRTHGFLAKQGTEKAGFLRPTAMGEQALYLATLYPDDVHKDEATAYQARFDKATKSSMNNEQKKAAARSLPALNTYRSVSAEERPEFLEPSEIPQISAEDAAHHAKEAELAGRFAYWMALTNSEYRNAPAPSPGLAPRPAETAGAAPQPHPEGRDAREAGKAPGGSGADERAVEARGDGGDTREASQPPSSTAEQSPAPSNTLGDTTSGTLLPIVSDEYAILYAASHELMAADQTPDGRWDTRRITLGWNEGQDGVLADADVVERLVQERLLEYRALMELYITPAGQQRLAELHRTERTAPAVGDRALILATGMVGIVCGYHTNDAGARYADVVCPSQDWPDGWDTNVGADFLTTIEPAVMGPQDAAELYRVAALRQVPGTLTDPDLRALALENLTAAAIQAPRVAQAARTHDIFAFAEALASWAYQWATEQWAEAPRDGWPDWVSAYFRDDDAAEPDRNGLYVELALSLHEQLRTTEPTDTAGHAETSAVQGAAREERPPTAEPARLPELNVTPPNREQVPQLETATPFADDADAQLDVDRLEGAFARWSQQPTVQEYLRQDDRARPNGQGAPDNPIAALRAAYEQATVALGGNTLGGLDDLLQRLQTVAAWCQVLEPAVDVDLRATLQELHTAVRRLAARSQATIEALATASTDAARAPGDQRTAHAPQDIDGTSPQSSAVGAAERGSTAPSAGGGGAEGTAPSSRDAQPDLEASESDKEPQRGRYVPWGWPLVLGMVGAVGEAKAERKAPALLEFSEPVPSKIQTSGLTEPQLIRRFLELDDYLLRWRAAEPVDAPRTKQARDAYAKRVYSLMHRYQDVLEEFDERRAARRNIASGRPPGPGEVLFGELVAGDRVLVAVHGEEGLVSCTVKRRSPEGYAVVGLDTTAGYRYENRYMPVRRAGSTQINDRRDDLAYLPGLEEEYGVLRRWLVKHPHDAEGRDAVHARAVHLAGLITDNPRFSGTLTALPSVQAVSRNPVQPSLFTEPESALPAPGSASTDQAPPAAGAAASSAAADGRRRAPEADHGRYLTPEQLADDPEARGFVSPEIEKALFSSNSKERIAHLAGQVTAVFRGDGLSQGRWYLGRYVGSVQADGPKGQHWRAHLPFGTARKAPLFAKREAALAYLALASEAHDQYRDLSRISPEQQRAFDFLKLAQGQKAYEAIAAAVGPANETALQSLANLTQALSNGHSPSGNVADDLGHVADEAQQLYEHAPYAAQSEDEFHQTMGSLIRRASTFLDTLRPDDPRANHHAAQRNLNALEYLRNRTTGDATATAGTVAADDLHNGDLVELSGHQLNPWGSKQGKTRGYVIGEPARATVDTGRGTQGDGWLVTLSEEPFGPPGFQSGRVVFAVPATNRRIKRFARATETGLPTHEIIHRKVRERDPGRPEQRSLFAPPANLQTSAAPTHGAADQQPPVANTGQSTAPAQGPRDRDATGHPDATPPSSSPAAQPAEQPKPGTPQADENPSDAPQPEPSKATDSTTPANETAPSNAPAAGEADTRSGGHASTDTTQPEKPESTETAANSPLPRTDEAASAQPADKHAVQIEELPEARPYTERIPLATAPYVLYLSGHDGQGPHSGEIHHGDTLVATVERTAANQWLSRTAGDNHFSDSTQEHATPHEAAHHGAIIHSVLTDTPYGKRPTAAPGATVEDRAEALRTEVRDAATRHQLAISRAAATTSPEFEQHPRYKELVARLGQMARTVADNHTSAQMAALFRETAETADAWLGALPTGPAADGRRALVSPLAHLRHDLTALQGRLQATLDAARAEQTTVPARPAASTRPDHNQRTPRPADEPKRSTASPSPSARPSPPAPTAPTSPQPAASSPKPTPQNTSTPAASPRPPAPPSAQPPKEVPPTQPSVSAQTTPAAPPASTPRDTMATNNNPHEPPRAEPLATDPAYQLHLSDPDSRGEVLHNSRPVADVYRTQSGDWIARMKGNAESADTTPFTSTPQEAAHQAAVLFSMKTGTPYGAKPTAAPGDGIAVQEAFLRTALRETAAKHKKVLATAVDQSPSGLAGYRQMELQLRRFDDAEQDAHDFSTMSATLFVVQQAVTGVLGRLPNTDLDETRQVMLYPLTELLYDLTQLRGRLNATIDAASDKPSVTRERDLDQPKESAAAQPADTATTASAPPSPSDPPTPPEPQPTTTPAAPPGPETTDNTTPDTPADPGQPEDAPSESSPEPRKQLPLWTGSRTWVEMDADSASTPVDFETLIKGLQEAFEELVAAGHADELRSAAQAVVDALDRRPVAPKTSPTAGTQSASTTRPPATAATATSNSQPTPAGAATQSSDQANQVAAVNKALQQADAHGAALADLPEWQQIQTIRGAFGNLGRVLRNRAGERFARLMADGRVARFMRRASIATCEAIARLAQRGADRLRRVDERRPLPSADALLHLGNKAFAYSAPPRPRRSERAAARAPLADGELDAAQLRKMGAALKRPSPRGPASSRTGPPNSKPGTGVSAAAARGRSTTTRRTPKGPGDGIPEQAKHLRRDGKEIGRARRR
ncbi:nucleotide exchange factor GrpE [Streptomyces noursei]|uniref:nucleotide exchange factor GrpE n=1 Tax=Streptomyces noursei TaxID=1971 RepID=UPI0023B8442B|nr:nucleotide exchange factor GrpE [Streptomyces noursei]